MSYYHGGNPELLIGESILPPSITGQPNCSEYGADFVHRKDRVYVTTEFMAAVIFASMHQSLKGCVYRVEPVGDLVLDPDCDQPGLSYECESAVIVEKIKIKPRKLSKVREVMLSI